MKSEHRYCPMCGDAAFLDSKNEISCHSCDFSGNPQMVFPVCPMCQSTRLNVDDKRVTCTEEGCGYSATAEKASLDYIYKMLGFDDDKSQSWDLQEYAINYPD